MTLPNSAIRSVIEILPKPEDRRARRLKSFRFWSPIEHGIIDSDASVRRSALQRSIWMNNNWSGFRRELAGYIKENQIPENEFRFLGVYEWQNVYKRVLERFVDSSYAKTCGLHWSNIENGFRREIDRIIEFGCFPEGSWQWMKKLPEIVNCEKVYLFLEDDERQDIKYWIAECSPSVVWLLINDTYGAGDYYMTDKKFNWMITENHHEYVQIIGRGLERIAIEKICIQYHIPVF